LLTSALRTLFKVSQLRNYFLKKFNTSIFDALNAQIFIKIYYLKSLKNVLRALVNISLNKNTTIQRVGLGYIVIFLFMAPLSNV